MNSHQHCSNDKVLTFMLMFNFLILSQVCSKVYVQTVNRETEGFIEIIYRNRDLGIPTIFHPSMKSQLDVTNCTNITNKCSAQVLEHPNLLPNSECTDITFSRLELIYACLLYTERNFKEIVHPKINSLIIYSASCCSSSALLSSMQQKRRTYEDWHLQLHWKGWTRFSMQL